MFEIIKNKKILELMKISPRNNPLHYKCNDLQFYRLKKACYKRSVTRTKFIQEAIEEKLEREGHE